MAKHLSPILRSQFSPDLPVEGSDTGSEQLVEPLVTNSSPEATFDVRQVEMVEIENLDSLGWDPYASFQVSDLREAEETGKFIDSDPDELPNQFRLAAKTQRKANTIRGISSVGRALAWHARGQGFESPILHFLTPF